MTMAGIFVSINLCTGIRNLSPTKNNHQLSDYTNIRKKLNVCQLIMALDFKVVFFLLLLPWKDSLLFKESIFRKEKLYETEIDTQ